MCHQGGMSARVPAMEKEGLIMCYKYWYSQETLADASRDERGKPRREQAVDDAREGGGRPRREQAVEEDEAMKRTQEVIEKARSAKPAPKASEPATSEKEKEAVPA